MPRSRTKSALASEDTFGGRLNALMHERGMTQRSLAVAAGVSESSISQYIAGNRQPQFNAFCTLCEVLDVPASALLPIDFAAGNEDAVRPVVREAAVYVADNAPLLTSQERRSLVCALFDAESQGSECVKQDGEVAAASE